MYDDRIKNRIHFNSLSHTLVLHTCKCPPYSASHYLVIQTMRSSSPTY